MFIIAWIGLIICWRCKCKSQSNDNNSERHCCLFEKRNDCGITGIIFYVITDCMFVTVFISCLIGLIKIK